MDDAYHVWVEFLPPVEGQSKVGVIIERGEKRVVQKATLYCADLGECAWKSAAWALSKLAGKKEPVVLHTRMDGLLKTWEMAKEKLPVVTAGEHGQFWKDVASHKTWTIKYTTHIGDFERYVDARRAAGTE